MGVISFKRPNLNGLSNRPLALGTASLTLDVTLGDNRRCLWIILFLSCCDSAHANLGYGRENYVRRASSNRCNANNPFEVSTMLAILSLLAPYQLSIKPLTCAPSEEGLLLRAFFSKEHFFEVLLAIASSDRRKKSMPIAMALVQFEYYHIR